MRHLRKLWVVEFASSPAFWLHDAGDILRSKNAIAARATNRFGRNCLNSANDFRRRETQHPWRRETDAKRPPSMKTVPDFRRFIQKARRVEASIAGGKLRA
jgi:hypothetical protein